MNTPITAQELVSRIWLTRRHAEAVALVEQYVAAQKATATPITDACVNYDLVPRAAASEIERQLRAKYEALATKLQRERALAHDVIIALHANRAAGTASEAAIYKESEGVLRHENGALRDHIKELSYQLDAARSDYDVHMRRAEKAEAELAEARKDKGRLDWLERKGYSLTQHTEIWEDHESTTWWQVTKGKKSLSGHPLACPRAAIDAAMPPAPAASKEEKS